MAGGTGLMTTFTDWDIIRNLLLAGLDGAAVAGRVHRRGAGDAVPCCCVSPADTRVGATPAGNIELFQGTPLLMQLFLAFFGVALFGVEAFRRGPPPRSPDAATSSFLLDIWFGSIRALPKANGKPRAVSG